MKEKFFTLLFLLKLIKEGNKLRFISLLVLSILSGILPIVEIQLINGMINLVVSRNFETIVFVIIAVFFIELIGIIFSSLLTTNSDILAMKIQNIMQIKILKKMEDINIEEFDDPQFMNLQHNAMQIAQNYSLGLINSGFRIVSQLSTLIGFTIVIINVHVLVLIVLVIFTLPYLFLKYKLEKKIDNIYIEQSLNRRKATFFFSIINNVKYFTEIKFNHALSFFKKKRDEAYECALEQKIKTFRINAFIDVTSNLIIFIGVYLVIVYILKIGNEEFYNNFYTIYMSIKSFVEIINGFILMVMLSYREIVQIGYIDRFIKYKIPSRKDTKDKKKIDSIKKIEFINVDFRYKNGQKNVLNNITCSFYTNEPVLIVGENGSGKSTLLKLILGLYYPTRGTIKVDGQDISDINIDQYQSLISCVFQEFCHFPLEISENITFSKDYDEIEIYNSLKSSNSIDFVEKMEKGIKTPLTKYFYEQGIELSGGQWQKIAISRLFYKKPQLAILDEPTSKLDHISARIFLNELFDKFSKSMVVCVSHDTSIANNFGKIIVLKDGFIERMGTHEELLENDEYYSKLSND